MSVSVSQLVAAFQAAFGGSGLAVGVVTGIGISIWGHLARKGTIGTLAGAAGASASSGAILGSIVGESVGSAFAGSVAGAATSAIATCIWSSLM